MKNETRKGVFYSNFQFHTNGKLEQKQSINDDSIKNDFQNDKVLLFILTLMVRKNILFENLAEMVQHIQCEK